MDDSRQLRRLPGLARGAKPRRADKGQFAYPIGAYPERDFPQQTGYDSRYIREGKYFYYKIALSRECIVPALINLLRLLPEQVFVVAQVHTDDYYKECDTYISSSPEPSVSLIRWITSWSHVALDDGFFGIGAFAEDPTVEIFLDEHKTIHMYHHDPDLAEQTLARLGIRFVMDIRMFWDEPHYHEPLPLVDRTSEDYLTAFEDLSDRYDLVIDDDEDENLDDEGSPLGITCWKAEIRGCRCAPPPDTGSTGFYSTLYLNAQSRGEAIEIVDSYMEQKGEYADLYLQLARIPEELLTSELRRRNSTSTEPAVWYELEQVDFEWKHSRN